MMYEVIESVDTGPQGDLLWALLQNPVARWVINSCAFYTLSQILSAVILSAKLFAVADLNVGSMWP